LFHAIYGNKYLAIFSFHYFVLVNKTIIIQETTHKLCKILACLLIHQSPSITIINDIIIIVDDQQLRDPLGGGGDYCACGRRSKPMLRLYAIVVVFVIGSESTR
jgi:hypothetical protein